MLVGRTPGIGLSADGVAQAATLAQRFGEIEIGAVLSSPMERARQTAAPIAAAAGVPVETIAGLNEIDVGDWTGAVFTTLEEQTAWEAWNRHRSLARCPGGETMLEVQARAVAAVMHAASRFPRQHVVMVSHQDVLKAVLAQIMGASLDHLERFSVEPASRSIVTVFDDGGARVDSINLALT